MLTSVLKGHAFAGTLALPPRLRLVWLERYADAITDTGGQPLFSSGRYSREVVGRLSGRSKSNSAHRTWKSYLCLTSISLAASRTFGSGSVSAASLITGDACSQGACEIHPNASIRILREESFLMTLRSGTMMRSPPNRPRNSTAMARSGSLFESRYLVRTGTASSPNLIISSTAPGEGGTLDQVLTPSTEPLPASSAL